MNQKMPAVAAEPTSLQGALNPSKERRSRPFTLVVGVDFSDLSERAVAMALTLVGMAGGGEIHLVHAKSPQRDDGDGAHDVETQLLHARERMGRLLPASLPGGARIQMHVSAAMPQMLINEIARDRGADLVVVGTNGRDGLSRALFGSVAEYVTRHAPCSVVTVRRRELTAEEQIEPPCPECVKAAAAGDEAHPRCARHSRSPVHAHRYSEMPEGFGGGSMSFRFPS
jgi:nucleotide-binding universal stress UspA family protein